MGLVVLALMAGAAILCSSVQGQLSGSDEDELLNIHNHFRGIVSPIATNMERMVWNSELAQVAQTYADQCVFQHNSQRSSQSPSYQYVGENLAVTSSSSANYTQLVQLWYDEVADYDYTSDSCSAVCGHYTQVVWATSNNLGCGAKLCATVEGFSSANSVILVCNYGPGGNYAGQSPYMTGTTSCSACPSEQPDCVGNLCSPEGFTPGGTGGRGESVTSLSLVILTSLAVLTYLLQ